MRELINICAIILSFELSWYFLRLGECLARKGVEGG